MLHRKIPLLLALPPDERGMKDLAKEGVGKFAIAQKINPEKVLLGALLKARNFATRTEAQTTEWLEKLKQKSEQRKEEFHESYWARLRKKKK